MVFLLLYLATIPLANWVVSHFGIVPVGFGFVAPAAVFVVGVAFTLRDLTQEHFEKSRVGRWPVVAAIFAGALLSLLVSPAQIAVASGSAFLFSELADFMVYTPLRKKNLPLALAASNVVGLVFDSILFLWLAFHSLAFLPGQIIGKAYMTALALVVLLLVRRRRSTSEPITKAG